MLYLGAMSSGQDVLAVPATLATEWMLGNGLGGSACGTVTGIQTRRTHGLLHAADLHGRVTTVLLKLDERLATDAGTVELPGNPTGGIIRAAGPCRLEAFRLDPWPTWRFHAADVVLEKSLFMIHGHNAVAVAYRHLAGPPARLTVSPLVVARAPTGIQKERADLGCAVQGVPGRVRIEMAIEYPALTLWHNGTFLPARVWVRGLDYPADRDAGMKAVEDALVPGYIECSLQAGGALHVVAATVDGLFRTLASEGRLGTPPPRTLAECVAALEGEERGRCAGSRRVALESADFTARQAAAAHGGPGATIARRRDPLLDERDGWTLPLARTIEQRLARRGHRLTLVTSLPEAEERGEHVLRSLPGLIALRAFDIARAVLRGYAEYLDDGLAPVAFDVGDGTPRYGDPEPALWMVHAADLLARRSDDLEFVKNGLYPQLESVMQHYRAGTRGGIRVDSDGLLGSGEGPEFSRPADLNALWYHALVAIAQLARVVGRKESGAFYLAWAHEHQKRFNESMWDEANGCLVRGLAAHGPEPGLTPGQLLAVSLPPALLPQERALRLVEVVERKLLAPGGLREEPGSARVSATWLGAFFSAYLRVHGRSPEAQAKVRGWFDAIAAGRSEGIQTLPTPAAAELLRVWIEDVDHTEIPLAVV